MSETENYFDALRQASKKEKEVHPEKYTSSEPWLRREVEQGGEAYLENLLKPVQALELLCEDLSEDGRTEMIKEYLSKNPEQEAALVKLAQLLENMSDENGPDQKLIQKSYHLTSTKALNFINRARRVLEWTEAVLPDSESEVEVVEDAS